MLDIVFSKLKQHGLKIKPEKCVLFRPKVKYLGHILSSSGVQADPKKTVAVEQWAKPTSLQELQRFLGFSSYYRRFVPGFAKLAAPLHKLVALLVRQKKGKKAPLKEFWTELHDEAFAAVKEKFVTPPVLGYPDFSQSFIVETDASSRALEPY